MRALTLILCLGLAGCATVSREECLAGDWTAIGARDGAEGREATAIFARHTRACARVDVTPDRTAWQAGYDAGLRQFCTPLGGLRAGEAGRPDRGLCPAGAQSGFQTGHALGFSAHRQRARIDDINREISNLRVRNRQLASAEGDTLPREWHLNQSELLSLRLDLTLARNELARIEREIRAFRAAQ